MRQSKSANFRCEDTFKPPNENLSAKKSKLHLLMNPKGDAINGTTAEHKPPTTSTPLTEELPYTPGNDYYKAYKMIPAGGQFNINKPKSKLDYSI
jgi:hypothetical protein